MATLIVKHNQLGVLFDREPHYEGMKSTHQISHKEKVYDDSNTPAVCRFIIGLRDCSEKCQDTAELHSAKQDKKVSHDSSTIQVQRNEEIHIVLLMIVAYEHVWPDQNLLF